VNSTLTRAGLFNLKQVVICFSVWKLPVISAPSYRRKNIGKNSTIRDKFVVKARYVESTMFDRETSGPAFHPPSFGSQVGALGEGQFQGILEMFVCHSGTLSYF
jgi:hypothetical protein